MDRLRPTCRVQIHRGVGIADARCGILQVKILRAFLAATILLLGTVAHSQVIPFGPNGVPGGPQLDGCAFGMCPMPFSPSMGPGGSNGAPAWVLSGAVIDMSFSTNQYFGCSVASCLIV